MQLLPRPLPHEQVPFPNPSFRAEASNTIYQLTVSFRHICRRTLVSISLLNELINHIPLHEPVRPAGVR